MTFLWQIPHCHTGFPGHSSDDGAWGSHERPSAFSWSLDQQRWGMKPTMMGVEQDITEIVYGDMFKGYE
jgi:hypothetical protein